MSYYDSAFGPVPLGTFPKELINRLVKGTTYDENQLRLLDEDARAALKEMDLLCLERWNNGERWPEKSE